MIIISAAREIYSCPVRHNKYFMKCFWCYEHERVLKKHHRIPDHLVDCFYTGKRPHKLFLIWWDGSVVESNGRETQIVLGGCEYKSDSLSFWQAVSCKPTFLDRHISTFWKDHFFPSCLSKWTMRNNSLPNPQFPDRLSCLIFPGSDT